MFKLFLLAAVFATLSGGAPLPKKVTAEDVHLNAVLPEDSSKKEVTEETTTETPEEDDHLPEVTSLKPSDANYFSRVITSIFEIPIVVLTAVRDLIQNAASTQFKPKP